MGIVQNIVALHTIFGSTGIRSIGDSAVLRVALQQSDQKKVSTHQ